MPRMVELEFFPEIILEIPESPGGSCCLKPVVGQSKTSRKMYLLAQHIQWKFKDKVNLVIPSKTDSMILLVKKYFQLKADIRKKRLGIHKLPSLALAGRILCEGEVPEEAEIERIVKELLKHYEQRKIKEN